MKTNQEIIDRFEQGLKAAFNNTDRPENRALIYLGASEAILLAMQALRESSIPEDQQAPLRTSLSRIGNIACDGASSAVKVFLKLPWWKKIVRWV